VTTGKWIVLDRSLSGHCCFDGTVVEASSLDPGSKPDRPYYRNAICESFEVEQAQQIADALNEKESPSAAILSLRNQIFKSAQRS
jgi:hypothetical protein